MIDDDRPPHGEPTHWHALAAESVLSTLRCTVAGLDTAESAARLQRHRPNTLPRAPQRSA